MSKVQSLRKPMNSDFFRVRKVFLAFLKESGIPTGEKNSIMREYDSKVNDVGDKTIAGIKSIHSLVQFLNNVSILFCLFN